MSSGCSNNTEANASVLLERIESTFRRYWQRFICLWLCKSSVRTTYYCIVDIVYFQALYKYILVLLIIEVITNSFYDNKLF